MPFAMITNAASKLVKQNLGAYENDIADHLALHWFLEPQDSSAQVREDNHVSMDQRLKFAPQRTLALGRLWTQERSLG